MENELDLELVKDKYFNMDETASVVMLPVNKLHPHKDNPRKDVGDVTELAASIKAGGLHQNLTVVEDGDGYTVIIGHRRLAACKLAGIEKVPCAIVEMDYKTQIATMLAENMQRVDLTVAEQAQSMQLCMDLGDTLESLADKTGFSKATVKHRLELAKLDPKKIPQQITVSEMELLEQIDDINKRNEMLQYVGTTNLKWWVKDAVDKQNAVKNWAILEELIEKETGITESSAKAFNEADRKRNTNEYVYPLSDYDAKEKTFKNHCRTLQEMLEQIRGSGIYRHDGDRLYTIVFGAETEEEPSNWEKAEKVRKERHDKLDAEWNKAQKLRYEYIYSHEPTQEEADKIEDLFFDELAGGGFRSYCRVFAKMILPDKEWPTTRECTDALGKKQMSKKKRALWLLSFDLLDVAPYGYDCTYTEGFAKRFATAIEMLNIIGYPISDVEQSLIDGTSELFKKEENNQ